MKLLQPSRTVLLDGRPVAISSELLLPQATVKDEGDSIVVTVSKDPRVTEVLGAGVAVAGDTLFRLGEQSFTGRMSRFIETLAGRHGLLRRHRGKLAFGFIHGNWALDNARPDGRWCGLNNEITLLRDLGCYADFTLPAAPERSVAGSSIVRRPTARSIASRATAKTSARRSSAFSPAAIRRRNSSDFARSSASVSARIPGSKEFTRATSAR